MTSTTALVSMASHWAANQLRRLARHNEVIPGAGAETSGGQSQQTDQLAKNRGIRSDYTERIVGINARAAKNQLIHLPEKTAQAMAGNCQLVGRDAGAYAANLGAC